MPQDPLWLVGDAAPVIKNLARRVHTITRTTHPSIWIGQGKSSAGMEHRSGRALDIIVSSRVGRLPTPAEKAGGNAVAAWLVLHATTLHVRHIIWDRRIFRARYAASGWSPLPGRTPQSSISDWHSDHIHVWLEDAAGTVPTAGLIEQKPGTPTPTPTPKPPARPFPRLAVDGDMGPLTIRALQRWAGAGVDGKLGPITRRAVQRRLRVTVDGSWGPETISALQRLVGAGVDGLLGPQTISALQSYLNRWAGYR